MEAADAAGNASEEGVQITLEIIEQIRHKQGVNGIHIMSVGWEEIVPRIVTEAGLLPKDFAINEATHSSEVPSGTRKSL